MDFFSIESTNCMGLAVLFSDKKVNYVRKYIEVKFPTIGTEFYDKITSIAPIIPTLPVHG